MSNWGDDEIKYNSSVDWKGFINCGIVLAILVGGFIAYLIRVLQ